MQAASPRSGQKHYRYRHTYDRLSRLTVANYSYFDGSWRQTGTAGNFDVPLVAYDRNGNISALKRRDHTSSLVDDLTYTYDAAGGRPNRLVAVGDAGGFAGWDAATAPAGTITYDANGNLTAFDADPYHLTGLVYDERNLPTQLEAGEGHMAHYRYSAAGQRTYKQVGSQPAEHYLLDGAATVGVVEGGSVRFANLLTPDGRVIGRYTANLDRRYYYTDHLGSTRAVVDGNGTVVETRDYYPYGLRMPDRTLEEASSAKEDYTGHERDAETSLHYAGARYYMSALGRWTSVDPILEEQSPASLLKQDGRLLVMSPYNYTYDNPVNLRDPDGRCPTCPVGAIGAGVGYVGGFAINAVKQFYSDEYQKSGFNWRQANAAGVKGAIFGGAVGLTGGASLGVGATALAGAAGNTAGGVVERTIDGNKNTKAVDGRDMAQDAVVGGLGGAVAGTAAKTANDFGILVTGSPVSTTTSTLAGEVTSQSASLATDPIMEVVTDQLNPAEDLLRQYEPNPATTNEPLFNE